MRCSTARWTTLTMPAARPPTFIRFELAMLAELGFGLDLENCRRHRRDRGPDLRLAKVRAARCREPPASPTGTACCGLPAFLREGEGGANGWSDHDLQDGFRLTGLFPAPPRAGAARARGHSDARDGFINAVTRNRARIMFGFRSFPPRSSSAGRPCERRDPYCRGPINLPRGLSHFLPQTLVVMWSLRSRLCEKSITTRLHRIEFYGRIACKPLAITFCSRKRSRGNSILAQDGRRRLSHSLVRRDHSWGCRLTGILPDSAEKFNASSWENDSYRRRAGRNPRGDAARCAGRALSRLRALDHHAPCAAGRPRRAEAGTKKQKPAHPLRHAPVTASTPVRRSRNPQRSSAT